MSKFKRERRYHVAKIKDIKSALTPSEIEFEKNQARELYRKIDGWDSKLIECHSCGYHAELWEYEPTPGTFQKVAMCSNDGDEDQEVEPCPMYMPPDGFYKASKIEAIEIWNKRFGNVLVKHQS